MSLVILQRKQQTAADEASGENADTGEDGAATVEDGAATVEDIAATVDVQAAGPSTKKKRKTSTKTRKQKDLLKLDEFLERDKEAEGTAADEEAS